MKDTWWKFLVLGLVIVGLLMWRKGQSEDQPVADIASEEEVEQRVNHLLEQANISLPENSERINLRALEGVEATGVVSLSKDENETRVAVIASLPENESENYVVWMVGDGVDALKLGRLRLAKGGYLLDQSVSEDLRQYERVLIGKESDLPDSPLLSGDLPADAVSK